MSVNTTKYNLNEIRKLEEKLIITLESLQNVENPNKRTFNSLLSGFEKICELLPGHFEFFHKITLAWINVAVDIKDKCKDAKNMKQFEVVLPSLTSYFVSIVSNDKATTKFRHSAFLTWSFLLENIPIDIKKSVVFGNIYAIKVIADTVFHTGHYPTQMRGFDILLRYISIHDDDKNEALENIFPLDDQSKIRTMIMEFDYQRFDRECRTFLNYFNMVKSDELPVFSVSAKSGYLGDRQVVNPMDENQPSELWVDFNSETKTVSYFCSSTTFSKNNGDHVFWVTVEANIDTINFEEEQNLLVIRTKSSPTCDSYIFEKYLADVREIRFFFDDKYFKPIISSKISKILNYSPEIGMHDDDEGKIVSLNSVTSNKGNISTRNSNIAPSYVSSSQQPSLKNNQMVRIHSQISIIDIHNYRKPDTVQNIIENYNKCLPARQRSFSETSGSNIILNNECQEIKKNAITEHVFENYSKLKNTAQASVDISKIFDNSPSTSKNDENINNKQLPLSDITEIYHLNDQRISTEGNTLSNINQHSTEEKRNFQKVKKTKIIQKNLTNNSSDFNKENIPPQQGNLQKMIKRLEPKKCVSRPRNKYLKQVKKPLEIKNLSPLTKNIFHMNVTNETDQDMRPVIEAYTENNGLVGITNILQKNYTNLDTQEKSNLRDNVKTINEILEKTTNKFFKSLPKTTVNINAYDFSTKFGGTRKNSRKRKGKGIPPIVDQNLAPKFFGDNNLTTYSYRKSKITKLDDYENGNLENCKIQIPEKKKTVKPKVNKKTELEKKEKQNIPEYVFSEDESRNSISLSSKSNILESTKSNFLTIDENNLINKGSKSISNIENGIDKVIIYSDKIDCITISSRTSERSEEPILNKSMIDNNELPYFDIDLISRTASRRITINSTDSENVDSIDVSTHTGNLDLGQDNQRNKDFPANIEDNWLLNKFFESVNKMPPPLEDKLITVCDIPSGLENGQSIDADKIPSTYTIEEIEQADSCIIDNIEKSLVIFDINEQSSVNIEEEIDVVNSDTASNYQPTSKIFSKVNSESSVDGSLTTKRKSSCILEEEHSPRKTRRLPNDDITDDSNTNENSILFNSVLAKYETKMSDIANDVFENIEQEYNIEECCETLEKLLEQFVEAQEYSVRKTESHLIRMDLLRNELNNERESLCNLIAVTYERDTKNIQERYRKLMEIFDQCKLDATNYCKEAIEQMDFIAEENMKEIWEEYLENIDKVININIKNHRNIGF